MCKPKGHLKNKNKMQCFFQTSNRPGLFCHMFHSENVKKQNYLKSLHSVYVSTHFVRGCEKMQENSLLHFLTISLKMSSNFTGRYKCVTSQWSATCEDEEMHLLNYR